MARLPSWRPWERPAGPSGSTPLVRQTWALSHLGLSGLRSRFFCELSTIASEALRYWFEKVFNTFVGGRDREPRIIFAGMGCGELRHDSACPPQGGPDWGTETGDIWLSSLGIFKCCSEQTSALALEKLPCASPATPNDCSSPGLEEGLKERDALSEEGVGMTDPQEFHTPGREPCLPGCPG